MFPILAIGTAISATATLIKGAMWLSDRISSARDEADAPGQAEAGASKPGRSSFDAALAAQSARQELPADASAPAGPTIETAPQILLPSDTQQESARVRPTLPSGPLIAGLPLSDAMRQMAQDDVQARVHAGMTAYGRLGERHDDRTAPGARHVEGK